MRDETPLLEVCVDSVESAVAADRGGAFRVELCDNLLEGGTTPSAGAIAVARDLLAIKLHAMIRPRGGDFLYSPVELDVMRSDIATAKRLGCDGVVFGVLTEDGSVDVERMRELVDLARPLSVTFHRAFDVAHDPFEALDRLIELGVDRVLTSGQESSVVEGLDVLVELVRRAGERLVVMPGGGVTERNIAKVVAATRAREIHVTGKHTVESRMAYRNPRVHMGGALRPPEYARTATDADAVARLRDLAIRRTGG
jgi:copper homeostasis protein